MDYNVAKQMQAFCLASPFGRLRTQPHFLSDPATDYTNPDKNAFYISNMYFTLPNLDKIGHYLLLEIATCKMHSCLQVLV